MKLLQNTFQMKSVIGLLQHLHELYKMLVLVIRNLDSVVLQMQLELEYLLKGMSIIFFFISRIFIDFF
ncbi:unnamed protein product [Trichobilharzia regenti]|nr:unnamed protein product [Trichobilharzia regenti]